MEINGLSAIITGGASGLGGATAALLAKTGAKVTIFDLNNELGLKLAKEIGGHFINVDISDEVAVEKALQHAYEINGIARILVNCAGIAPPAKVIDRDGKPQSLMNFAKIININLTGSFNILSKFAARLYNADIIGDEERGIIINTASAAAFDGQIGQAAYAASKGGIVSMTLPLARELARYGIRVMAIAPGLFMTPMMATLPQDAQDSLSKQPPFPNRLGKPQEFAQLVEAIIRNPMLNAEIIRLDGALRMAAK